MEHQRAHKGLKMGFDQKKHNGQLVKQKSSDAERHRINTFLQKRKRQSPPQFKTDSNQTIIIDDIKSGS